MIFPFNILFLESFRKCVQPRNWICIKVFDICSRDQFDEIFKQFLEMNHMINMKAKTLLRVEARIGWAFLDGIIGPEFFYLVFDRNSSSYFILAS